jgi:hypothetical protein
VNGAIFLPEHHQIDAGPLQLTGERGPIRFDAAAKAALHAGVGEQPLLESRVGQLTRQRPGKARSRNTLEIILDGAAGHAERASHLSGAHPVAGKPQHLSDLSHGQFSLGRHQNPSSMTRP